LRYDESEGPTQVDFSEADQYVVGRESDLAGKDFQEKMHGWTNPLGWTDDGTDDDVILNREEVPE